MDACENYKNVTITHHIDALDQYLYHETFNKNEYDPQKLNRICKTPEKKEILKST